ncbi:MAG TPA: DEAD/DEAH box helicase [Ignavibacteria bacterium]
MQKIRFEDFVVSHELRLAVKEMGFEEPTPIQAQTIPLLLKGKDLIGQAQTGTGKTAAFGIPIIEKILSSVKDTQALVLCPTRELAIQVAEEFAELLKHKKNINVVPVYGGQPIGRQMQALRKGAQIIIATPGRLIDHIERHTIRLNNVKMVVLDEADEMIDMGFRDDIERILRNIPKERQTIFFSATMSKPILELTKRYLKNPEHVRIIHKELTVPSISQYYFEVNQSMKIETLSRLIDVHDPKLSLVFCNTKRTVDFLVSHLHARGYLAEGLHGDMNQNQRERVMNKFRTGKMDILVATDVAARGIDVEEIDAVFNYDMPQDEEYYVHRIGRTARAGRAGHAFTFAVGKEIYKIRDIERFTKSKIIRKHIPKAEDVEERKTINILDDIKAAIGDGRDLTKYENMIEKLLNEDFTTIEIASGLLKMIMKSEKPSGTPKAFIENEPKWSTGEYKGNGKRDHKHFKSKSKRY